MMGNRLEECGCQERLHNNNNLARTLWLRGDMEKIMKHPQAENSELYSVHKTAWFVTKDYQNFLYEMLVWQDEIKILNSWLSILNPQSSTLNFRFSILHYSCFYLKSPLPNFYSLSSTLLPPSSVQTTGYLTHNVLNIAGFLAKCPQAPLAPLPAFSRSDSDEKIQWGIKEFWYKVNLHFYIC